MHLLIIIPVLNDPIGLRNTFKSLTSQSISNFSVRIQDPNDFSLSSQFLSNEIHFSVELDHTVDNGISNAFNKAILNSNSFWSHVLFLGAGDTLVNSYTVSCIYDHISTNSDCLLHAFSVNRLSVWQGSLY